MKVETVLPLGKVDPGLRKRSAGLATSTEFSIPVISEVEYERLAHLLKELRQS